jgi:hypothetical protein
VLFVLIFCYIFARKCFTQNLKTSMYYFMYQSSYDVTLLTRLERCTLWSTLAFQRCRSLLHYCDPRPLFATMCSNNDLARVLQPGRWKFRGIQAWWPRQQRGGPWGNAPEATIAGGQAPTTQASWVVKSQEWNKKSPLGLGVDGITWGGDPGGVVPGNGLAPYVVKPIGGNPDSPEAWMI